MEPSEVLGGEMEAPHIRAGHGPEYFIQKRIVTYLQQRGWHIERMVGGAFQSGIPDLYVHHPKYGSRWLEIKNKARYVFTKAQKIKFPIWESVGIGIWIMVEANQEEYDKLFAAPNWREFWKQSYEDEMNVEKILDDEYPD